MLNRASFLPLSVLGRSVRARSARATRPRRNLHCLSSTPSIATPFVPKHQRLWTPTEQPAARGFASASASFPSMVITADAVDAQGAFAKTQAEFLEPDPQAVAAVQKALEASNCALVAHFYMDPELQGVLAAVDWPHLLIADSLAMGLQSVSMAKTGVDSIACLGVDFMAENVEATLRAAGLETPVYRLSEQRIGCSLAESAETPTYSAYLLKASQTPCSLHVTYINTSLLTKARANSRLPTLTCTSSNVVFSCLQAYAQVPGLTIWFGPDAYMGENLMKMFTYMAESLDDETIRNSVHPEHSVASIKAILDEGRFEYYKQGICVVHHMFGGEVAKRVESQYGDAHLTAHLEVPGEMFQVSLKAAQQGRGVVGSTSDILNHITEQTEQAVEKGGDHHLKFVLGTESGMMTSIVRQVQKILRAGGSAASGVKCEVIFPVGVDAVSNDDELGLIPGAQMSEGCSIGGGCATCPYMQMNSLDSLIDLLEVLASRKNKKDAKAALEGFRPKMLEGGLVDGVSVAIAGAVPISHMRELQKTKTLGETLLQDIRTRTVQASA